MREGTEVQLSLLVQPQGRAIQQIKTKVKFDGRREPIGEPHYNKHEGDIYLRSSELARVVPYSRVYDNSGGLLGWAGSDVTTPNTFYVMQRPPCLDINTGKERTGFDDDAIAFVNSRGHVSGTLRIVRLWERNIVLRHESFRGKSSEVEYARLHFGTNGRLSVVVYDNNHNIRRVRSFGFGLKNHGRDLPAFTRVVAERDEKSGTESLIREALAYVTRNKSRKNKNFPLRLATVVLYAKTPEFPGG